MPTPPRRSCAKPAQSTQSPRCYMPRAWQGWLAVTTRNFLKQPSASSSSSPSACPGPRTQHRNPPPKLQHNRDFMAAESLKIDDLQKAVADFKDPETGLAAAGQKQIRDLGL